MFRVNASGFKIFFFFFFFQFFQVNPNFLRKIFVDENEN